VTNNYPDGFDHDHYDTLFGDPCEECDEEECDCAEQARTRAEEAEAEHYHYEDLHAALY